VCLPFGPVSEENDVRQSNIIQEYLLSHPCEAEINPETETSQQMVD